MSPDVLPKRFSAIRLQNWRNYGQVQVSLQNRVFLVGPNAVGKSNFLDAFRFLRDLVTPGGGFQKATTDRGGITRIRNLAARKPPEVALEVEMVDNTDTPIWRYRVAFGWDKGEKQLRLTEEKVWKGDQVALSRPDDNDRSDPARLSQTHLEQTIANQHFRAIADFFHRIQYYHIVPQLVRDPERSLGRQIDPYGGDFLEQIARTPKNTRKARLNRILDALRIAVPQFSALELENDERGVPHLRGNYQHWRPRGAWQSEADFSDGTLRLLGLLWALQDGDGLLLLEEPELSLHSEIVRHIPTMMHRIQRRQRSGRQIFLSTHSSDLLRDPGITAEEVLLVRPSEGGSEIYVGAEFGQITTLLEAGLSVADVVLPYTQPTNAHQLALWG